MLSGKHNVVELGIDRGMVDGCGFIDLEARKGIDMYAGGDGCRDVCRGSSLGQGYGGLEVVDPDFRFVRMVDFPILAIEYSVAVENGDSKANGGGRTIATSSE